MGHHRCQLSGPVHLSPIVERWIWRLLIPSGVQRKFVMRREFHDEALAVALGLSEWTEPDGREFSPKAIRIELRRRYAEAEQRLQSSGPSALSANIIRLQALVGLSEADCRVLEFAVSIHSDRFLDTAAEGLGLLSTLQDPASHIHLLVDT